MKLNEIISDDEGILDSQTRHACEEYYKYLSTILSHREKLNADEKFAHDRRHDRYQDRIVTYFDCASIHSFMLWINNEKVYGLALTDEANGDVDVGDNMIVIPFPFKYYMAVKHGEFDEAAKEKLANLMKKY